MSVEIIIKQHMGINGNMFNNFMFYIFMVLIMSKQEIPIGSILISYNNNDSMNHHFRGAKWNHLAIYIGDGFIVESQAEKGVIKTPMSEYLKRDYTWGILYPKNRQDGVNAAETSKKLIGSDYRKASSIFKKNIKPSKGLNCISVIRTSYNIYLVTPDDILKYPNLFTKDIKQVK